ncbi:uncharacterized protein LAESUDRAFT_720038 [Laetiporus sulphureus 93-53]|uniref:Zn(2)-C6 fungal-type domain-containing protein n=1 Tax=Laetiporus sulphureus 93-53 TaxID=1314785 RepID=A0A165HQT4_9APHY|nr:uncharacterized protein LAESUDRAFT_720038 [Laetiporus sulphureus 93-53]KZT12061.1 hypothetical protein LAESUDRAFT_720038 [Laetiporus sulphureus 93-53]
MLSISSHLSMQSTSEYVDDSRPAKRPRQDDLCDSVVRPFTIPAPSAHPETDPAENSSKRNRKRPLSCGECRRLKLKCDRVFPCQSCCKRGCAEICPDGALTGGKGSRFILANTEQLHEKIKSMAERIRQLEDALQTIQAQHSTESHPLLRQELLSIKRSPELFGMDRNAIAANHNINILSVHKEEDDHRSTGSSGTPPDVGDDYASSSSVSVSASVTQLGLPEEIVRLSRACPVPPSMSADLNPDLRRSIRDLLPPPNEGQRICEQARRNAFWHYSPDTSESFIPNLVHSVYYTQLNTLLPHRLSLFLIVLAIGTAVDLQPSHDRHAAEKYHHLARAALCETAVVDDPSFDTINTLFYMVWYLLMFSNHKRAAEHAWGIMGLLAKLAQSLGLHRDGVGKMIPEELDKRKALLWNMMSVDVRLALMLRRPPSLSIHHVDVKRPAYNFFDSPTASISATYHEWRDTFLAQCQYPVLELIIAPQPPPYADVLALDTKIRDLEIPPALHMVDTDAGAPQHPVGLQQALTLCTREIAILNLHRSYLTQALRAQDGFTIKSKYSPSVLAVYSSACNLIWTVHTCYKWEPELIVRFSVVWSNCLSAALALCLILGRAPSSPLSPHALAEVDKVRRLFIEVRDRCPAVAKALPALEACAAKARSVYVGWCHGSVDCYGDSENDEVCALVRRTVMTPPEDAGSATQEAHPFEHAHFSLKHCYEKFIAEHPSGRVEPYSTQQDSLRFGVSQSYSMSAERTMHDPHASINGADASTSQNTYNPGWMGTEFLDSSWMTWF